MGRFTDKVIVITGGGSGLGRECALWWAAEGGKIVVTDLIEKRANDVAGQITGKGGEAIARKCDVKVEAEVEAAVQAAVAEWGRIDIMFSNAGKAPEGFGTVPFEDVTEEQWEDLNDVIFRGVFFAGKHAARQMKKQGGGNIVVTVSAAGLNAYPGFGPYVAGKTGAIGIIRAMAYDWDRHGIRVNGLAPVHGMSVNFAMPPEADVLGLSYEEAQLAQSGAVWEPRTMFPGPYKTSQPPAIKHNAAVATFLASDDSEYMSGVTIPSCDGGNFARTSIAFPEAWSLEDEAAQ